MSYAMFFIKERKIYNRICTYRDLWPIFAVFRGFSRLFRKNHIRLTMAHTFLDLSHHSESNDMQHGYVLTSRLGDMCPFIVW